MRSTWCLLLFIFSQAYAHQTSVTSSQTPIRWNASVIPIQIINNSTSLLTSESLIEQSINEWNTASSLGIMEVSSSRNQIKFSQDFSIYGSAVVGVTEVNYGTNGIINTASILLNEQNYNFTSTMGIASGNNVYLKDVVTHELGHFIGLNHSEVLNASMFYSTFPGQSDLAADDKAGIRSKYDSGYGTISGSIKGGDHVGVFGAHVQAISRNTGEAVGAITNEDGRFTISGLDLNDTYYLYNSPLKNLSALPSYLANVQTDFCPGSYLGSFFTVCGRENDGLPQGINLTSSAPKVDVGEITISCSLRTQEDYTFEKIQPSFQAVEILNYSFEPRHEKAFVGFFRANELSTLVYTPADKLIVDLRSVSSPGSKSVSIQLISHALGNMVEYNVIVKQNGSVVYNSNKVLTSYNIYQLDLGAELALSTNAANNFFEIEIKAKKLTETLALYSIPDATNFGSKQHLPYLLMMSLKSGAGLIMDSGSSLSDNSSCLDAPFTFPVEKAKFNTDEESKTAAAAASVAGCGTIEPPQGPGPGSFFLLSTLGFLFSYLAISLSKKGKNFLS